MKKSSRDRRVAMNEIYDKVKKMATDTKYQNTETPEDFNTRVFPNSQIKKHGDDSRK